MHTILVLIASLIIAFVVPLCLFIKSGQKDFAGWWDAEGAPIYGLALVVVIAFDFWIGWLR